MQRIRSIKPAFFMSETVGAVSFAARLLFIGLWTLADREGRLVWKPKEIRAQVFPHDVDLQLAPLAEDLVREGHIRFYQDDDRVYVWIPEFTKHQRPHVKEPASTLPPWPNGSVRGWLPWRPASPSGPRRDAPGPAPAETGEFPSSTAGREGKGREQEGKVPPVVPQGGRAPGEPLIARGESLTWQRERDRYHRHCAPELCTHRDTSPTRCMSGKQLRDLAGSDTPEARARVVAWAQADRPAAEWAAPGDSFAYWTRRWDEAGPGAKAKRVDPREAERQESEKRHAFLLAQTEARLRAVGE